MGCADSQPVTTPSRPISRARTSRKKLNRLLTKYSPSQIRPISDQQRKAGFRPAYTCPICTSRYNKILACEECKNCICLDCYLTYEKKSRYNFRCSFCGSESSMFKDYEEEAHSYFDTTGNNGFLTAEEREKIDQELREKAGKSKLETIKEIEAS